MKTVIPGRGNNLKGFKDTCLKNSSSQGQKLAVTIFYVPYSCWFLTSYTPHRHPPVPRNTACLRCPILHTQHPTLYRVDAAAGRSSRRNQIALFRSLICTDARRNLATCRANQGM